MFINKTISLFVLFALIITLGCTHTVSFNANYKQGDINLTGINITSSKTIGITVFENRSPLIQKENDKSKSYVGNDKESLFYTVYYGVSYNSNEFVPINSILQDLIVSECNHVGMKVKKVNKEIINADGKTLQQVAKEENVDYILDGYISQFDFYNQFYDMNYDSTRSIYLTLKLVKSDGTIIFSNKSFSDSDKEKKEALNIDNKNNVDALFNNVLKNVIRKVIVKVSDNLQWKRIHVKFRFVGLIIL